VKITMVKRLFNLKFSPGSWTSLDPEDDGLLLIRVYSVSDSG
jgi:hypothetical protein